MKNDRTTRTLATAPRLRVAIVYPFFAHYREPLLRELLLNGRHEYVLAGGTHDPTGTIPALQFAQEPRFVHTRLVQVHGRLLWQSGLLKLAWRDDVDCLVYLGNAEFFATWLSAFIARCRKRRVLFWTHGWIRRESGMKAAVRRLFYRLADGLLLYGHRARQIGIEAGFAASSLHVIYNSLDVQGQQRLLAGVTDIDVRKTRLELFGSAAIPVVIATGRLTAVKRFDLLIGAAAALASAGHRVNVLIVGTGPAENSLRELAAAGNVPVVFYGACYDEPTLARLFAAANVTVSPGNVGLTCMHSLGYGVPVITHDDADAQMPEWEAITPGVTGDFFSRDAVNELADAIRRWTAAPRVSETTRRHCIRMVEERYHPRVQRQLFERAAECGLHDPSAARIASAADQLP